MKSVNEHLKEYFNAHKQSLKKFYPGLDINYFSEKFLEYSGLNRDEVYLNTHDDFFDQVRSGVPLEYLTESKFFYRSEFFVNKDVLIPRSETEILVERAISLIKNNNLKTLAEIGVGSGCISLSIAMECPGVKILATDISELALKVASINLSRHQNKILEETQLTLECTDRLNGINKKFDLIVSNPPYIKESDEVHEQVLKFEPQTALFLADEDYNDWFSDLFQQVSNNLSEKGIFLMEGHEDHLAALQKLSLSNFTRTEILEDYTNRDRFLICYK
ncbi:MAG: hypothetical protein CME65_03535 [Halobacteriovoraceae bacterium]|nr:hypothetical protein [Halobacteriovoraceae bacterium]|tara:strand:- start:6540 stop:7367 length:828 start_codon:yes stop_codon:yes gene_type:complete